MEISVINVNCLNKRISSLLLELLGLLFLKKKKNHFTLGWIILLSFNRGFLTALNSVSGDKDAFRASGTGMAPVTWGTCLLFPGREADPERPLCTTWSSGTFNLKISVCQSGIF